MPKLLYDEKPTRSIQTCHAGQTILAASLANKLAHYHECGGQARCSTCRVIVIHGHQHLSARSEAERALAKRKGWPGCVRLACQAAVQGDVTIRRLVVDDEDLNMVFDEMPDTHGGDERPVVVMFSDIRDFTTFAHHQLPHDVVHILNRYFKKVCDPILAHGGYIDKYLGDGVLAVFGLEGGDSRALCESAMRASLGMLEKLTEVNTYLRLYFDLEFNIGIGLHFGPVIVGEIGHPAKRQMTVMGDTVNVASRIEAANKRLKTQLLVSSDLLGYLRDTVETGKSCRLRLKGKPGLQTITEISRLKS